MNKILIVDDSEFMRMLLKNAVTKNGYEIAAEANTGRQAIEYFIKFKPDIVTLDLTLPDISGIEVLKAIMALDSKAKVIMVSAMGQTGFVEEAILSGAKDFVVKPFKDDTIIPALRRLG